MSRTMGLDLSLTHTGIVVWNGKKVCDERVVRTTTQDCDEERIKGIAITVRRIWKVHQPVWTAIENYSYGTPQGMARLGELGGVVKHMLYIMMAPFYTVPPTSLKKFATGKGNATKAEMVDAARGFITVNEDNVADAFHLARHAWEEHP